MANAPIAAEMIQRFERDGYLVIPNLFSAEEVALFRAELDRAGYRNTKIVASSGVIVPLCRAREICMTFRNL